LAGKLGGEIVSADSRQVYRYMEVGTAKPSISERAAVPHHLVDVVYPDEPYSIADYQRDARRALADIAGRGRVALVVGGSPHYIQALIDRLAPAARFPRLRGWLEKADRSRAAVLDDWLRRLDPTAAGAIDFRNRRRVLRALEIILGTGQRFSDVGRRRDEAIPSLWIGLRLDRASLYDRVERRMDAMLADGWQHEVRRLLAMGFAPDLPSMSATGYAELIQCQRCEISLEDARAHILHATHSFIRRQETWLRKEPRIQWFDAGDPRLQEQAEAACLAFRHNGEILQK
jgi:tRNA dimethylallyltransferase